MKYIKEDSMRLEFIVPASQDGRKLKSWGHGDIKTDDVIIY